MAVTLLYTIRDAKGESSTMEIKAPDSFAFANLASFAQAMASLINDLITGTITRVGVAYIIDLPGGLRTSALTNSDVEEGAKFQFRTAGGFPTGCRIPTFDETKIASNSKDVDLTDTDVAAFVTAMISGVAVSPGAVTVTPSDAREDDIVALVSAKEQFMSSRG